MPSPEVSVILPAHGDADFLRDAVESILADPDELLELLVVDDRLSEAGRKCITQIEDARLRMVPSDGEGLVSALNTGLRNAQGDFIARMDADDVAHPGRLTRQAAFLRNHADVVVVGGQLRVIDEFGTVIGRRRYPTESTALRRMLRHRNAFAHPAVMFRRQIALAAGGYREAFTAAEDYEFWLRLSERGELANLADVVLDYRVHGGQVTNTNAVLVAESTYLAQWSAGQRLRGRADTPLPWVPGLRPKSATLPARFARWRVVTAARLFVRLRMSISMKRYPLAVLQGLLWVALRPRYATAQVALTGDWLRTAMRPRTSQQ